MSQQFLPDLIAVQEHKLKTDNDIAEASAFMLKQGYASYWAKADSGPKGQPIAGVAVMVATKFGSKPVVLTDAPTGRLVACKVQMQGEAELIFLSAYLYSGRGLKLPNLQILAEVAATQKQETDTC